MAVTQITSEDHFKTELESAGDKLVLVDFYADWCGPCRAIAPKIKELAEKHQDVVFLKVNVDDQSELAEKYEISAMPTFLYFKNGQSIQKVIGADANKVEEKVKEHK